jgi:hypothetical protein
MSRNPLLLALASVVTAVATALGVAVFGAPAGPPLVEPVETSAAKAPSRPAPIGPVEILRAWDARRAQAWARGDPRLLRALYTPGSVAGRHDLAMLRAWAARGLVVRQLRTQLLSVREVAHTPSSWTLMVTDRVAGGVAVGAGVRRPLPTDQATARTVLLRRVRGSWLVSAVQPLDPGP